ncbi:branched-chain amino acid transporter permease [Helicobacter sp. UBA3407]|uniref:branched-chain amino acid transporter permease n=1 Tax=Helicobacter TaxID=209 RepID=UPI00261BF099|nr:AzlD domain-containing protein [Helicobacter sp. UBA3407]
MDCEQSEATQCISRELKGRNGNTNKRKFNFGLYFLGNFCCTALTRFLPFFAFKNATNQPLLRYLQETMPLLIMTLLVFFSLKDTTWSETYGLYEMGGVACATLCFMLTKNSVLSIFAGIIFYIFALKIF